MLPSLNPGDHSESGHNYNDVQMQDGDPYNKGKYTRNQSLNQNSKGAFSSAEDIQPAIKYSPMMSNSVTSPTQQFIPFNQNQADYSTGNQYQARQSPSRPNYTSAAQSYYSQQQQQQQHAGQQTVSRNGSSGNTLHPISSSTQQGPPMSQIPAHSPSINLHTASPSQQLQTPYQGTIRPGSASHQSTGEGPPRYYTTSSSTTVGSSHVSNPSVNTPLQQETAHQFQRLVPTSALNMETKTNAQPLFRRAHPEGGFISPLQALTCSLPSTYRICNPNFKYESSRNPRRVLTKPSKGLKNDGYDNEDSDYILYVNDILGSEEAGHKNRYLILDVLGQGTFGQVVKCQNLKTQEVVAVKVVKNRTAYFNQSMMEVSVLDLLNSKLDKNDDHHILRLKDTFIHRQHLCLVFELLSVNLYELIKQNQFRGLSTTLVRVFAQQLLNALTLLNKAKLIHCDLKPENILLKKIRVSNTIGTNSAHSLESPIIKVIDFGSACDERQTVYTYIQSRFYRSPEVLLCLPYSSAIDMWSLGCIVVELFLGLPLFPGSSEYNQVSRIVEMLGLPPTWMLEMGKQSGEFFEKVTDEFGRKTYQLKSMEKYSREHGTKEQPSKKYFQATTLNDIITQYSMPRKNMKPAEIEREMNNRVAFIDFVRGLLNINPLERWSPQQAKLHPFITQQKYTGPFVPPMNLKTPPLSQKSPMPSMPSNSQQQTQQQHHQTDHNKSATNHSQQSSSFSANYMSSGQQQQQQAQQPVYSNAYVPQQQQQQAQSHQYQNSTQPPSYTGNTDQHDTSNLSMPSHPNIPQQQPQLNFGNQPNLYQTATTRAGRQRASTIGQNDGGIPPQISRHASMLDPTQPIRLQPSPAYYPPPLDGDGNRSRRRSQIGQQGGGQQQQQQRGQRDFIRTLEDRTLEDGLFNNHQ